MRGGKREGSGRPSRKLPITKVTVYREDYEKLIELSQNLQVKIPVVELLYRIIRHKDFDNIVTDIDKNLVKDWHEQEV